MRWKLVPMVKARRWSREKRTAVLSLAVAFALGIFGVQPSYIEAPRREVFFLPYVPPLCRAIIDQKPADGWTRLSYDGGYVVSFSCGTGDGRHAETVQPLVLVKR